MMKIITPKIYFRVGRVSREERGYHQEATQKSSKAAGKIAYLPSPGSVPKEPPRQRG